MKTLEGQPPHAIRAERCARISPSVATYVLLLLAITACQPSPEQQAQVEARQREHCLNNICPGDHPPKYDWNKETLFKRGGKWFVGPKEYFSMDEGAFYWPSKHPAHAGGDYPEKGQKFFDIAVEFFIDANENGDTYEVVRQMEREGAIVERTRLTPTLQRLRHNQAGFEYFYVSTQYKTPRRGLPIAASCGDKEKSRSCSAGLDWRPGYNIHVRFPVRYSEDWPAIYNEILMVLKQVKEK